MRNLVLAAVAALCLCVSVKAEGGTIPTPGGTIPTPSCQTCAAGTIPTPLEDDSLWENIFDFFFGESD